MTLLQVNGARYGLMLEERRDVQLLEGCPHDGLYEIKVLKKSGVC